LDVIVFGITFEYRITINKMSTCFVVRDTYHPQEDLDRNWSASIGGWDIGDFVGSIY